MNDIKAIHLVLAKWCPHCYPTTVASLEKVAGDLGIPLYSYDIDFPDQEAKADELVRKFGDWTEDYLIPQVFVETESGEIRHIFTGNPEGVALTKRGLDDLLKSPMFTKNKHPKR